MHECHEDGKGQEIGKDNAGEQFPACQSQVDIEENGIPVPEPHDKIHGDNSNYGLYDERIHHESVGKPACLESGTHEVIRCPNQEYSFPKTPSE